MTLFKPDGDPFLDYPELSEYEEFTVLNLKDFRFVWQYANKTSPTEGNKKKSYIAVYGETNDTRMSKFLDGSFPADIRAAIEVMKNFSPSVRMKSKMMVEKIFNDYDQIANIDLTGLENEECKKVMSMKQDVVKNLPDIIRRMEEGFGIKLEEKKESDNRENTLMDKIHDTLAKQ